ncbi:MAG: NADP-dependent oxidoreductase [Mucilaginibacter polytrichastri]|nr:NADP-dependent oxidoreductase [Mucilaginibacter polytrichastri]
MKAILLEGFGPAENLQLREIEKPAPGADDVLVRVKAISINPVDAKTRAGKGVAGRFRDADPVILGWDISGTIEETGSRVTAFKTGDAVFGMVNFPGRGNAYAEYVVAPAAQLALKPARISHEDAAAATLAALTALEALVDHLKVQKGEKLLIHAAAGGVGHFAVQLGRHLGAHVIGTSSAANRDFVLNMGADEHIDYRSQKLEDAVSGVDKVLDSVGGETIVQSLLVMKKGGIIVSLPSGKNDQVAEKAAEKGISGMPMMVQSSGANMETIADLLERGILRPHVSKTFPLAGMADAHRFLETGRTVGKVVILP